MTKTLLTFTALLWAALSAGLQGQEAALEGIWEGDLMILSDQVLGLRLTIDAAADGTLSATLESPDQPSLQAMTAQSFAFEDNRLTFTIPELAGGYQGRLDGDTLQGTWITSRGISTPLSLHRDQPLVISDADARKIHGSWIGRLNPGNGAAVAVVFRFEADSQGKLIGYLDSPDEGAASILINGIGMTDDGLTLEVDRIRLRVTGILDADSLKGEWAQPGRRLPLTLERGEYRMADVSLTEPQFQRLAGPWHGTAGPFNMGFRFERHRDGQFVAFVDNPDQGATNIPVTQLSMDSDRLTLRADGVDGGFVGLLENDEITGVWQQRGQQSALTLKKGPYIPNPELSSEDQQQLDGSWRGTATGAELVFRFAVDGAQFLTHVDIPSVGMLNVPVSNMALDGSDLRFNVVAIDATFVGSLNGNQASGTFTRQGMPSPMTLVRD